MYVTSGIKNASKTTVISQKFTFSYLHDK